MKEKKTRKKITDVAIEVIKENDLEGLGYGDYGLLDKVFSRAKKEGIVKEIGSRGGRLRPHPLNRHKIVLDAMDRDKKRFKKWFFRCTNGRAEVLVRSFTLKDSVMKI